MVAAHSDPSFACFCGPIVLCPHRETTTIVAHLEQRILLYIEGRVVLLFFFFFWPFG